MAKGGMTKSQVQKQCVNLLQQKLPSVLPVMRNRLKRWQLDIPEGHLARQATSLVNRAWKVAPPRVAMVLLRTYLYAWTTSRRFQDCHSPCCLCRVKGAQDSLEHFVFCPVVQEIATKIFKMAPFKDNGCLMSSRRRFLCFEAYTDEKLALGLLFLKVIYDLHNHKKHGGGYDCNLKDSLDLARTYLYRASRGNSHTEAVVRRVLPTALPDFNTPKKKEKKRLPDATGDRPSKRRAGPGRPQEDLS